MKHISDNQDISLSYLEIENEYYFKISNIDQLRPFFMSVVSDSNHWMFISSNGGLTAGRKNSEQALFPYYTDDKITESGEFTGSKSIFIVHQEGSVNLWEPFSDRMEGVYGITRNLYKSYFGNKILFEEINHSLNLRYLYSWNSSDQFGFVRKSKLINESGKKLKIRFLDGIQNILPAGVGTYLQSQSSNLVDAYKRNELERETGIGIYALSAIIVDKAEPSEALRANLVWSTGFKKPTILLSSLQIRNFRKGQDLKEESDIKGERGAYFISDIIELNSAEEKEWMIIADVNKSHADLAKLSEILKKEDNLIRVVNDDIDKGSKHLLNLTAAADALQRTSDRLKDARHYSNVLFNIMRGGVFPFNYQIQKEDLKDYLIKANAEIYSRYQSFIEELPGQFSYSSLRSFARKPDHADFQRLCNEYLPLTFSRRHGDPSRPWNKFNINTKNELNGSRILDYEGNWRDIFQNWEALAVSFPDFLESMIYKFLNASTFDGYNPYRISKSGFDWETIEPDDPWSYIGYWGDHQIIYLLKLLEKLNDHCPERLNSLMSEQVFVYANVPYRIRDYRQILSDPRDTIDFDREEDGRIRQRRAATGADGALLRDGQGHIHHVNFIEKILATVLSKMSNFIPEGGIWMNTQRPEWNDANNALVGHGVSMVTLYYLRRFLRFFEVILKPAETEEFLLSKEVRFFLLNITRVLDENKHLLKTRINDQARKVILDGLGEAGSIYRTTIYREAFSGELAPVTKEELVHFLTQSREFIEHSIRSNKRADQLYHAYNLMSLVNDKEIRIEHLDEMLEGQVAVLSSGYLSTRESIEILDALEQSALFRKDQQSYILYPDKAIPLFQEKNRVPESALRDCQGILKMIQESDPAIIEKDIKGYYHFNARFKNARDLESALETLSKSSPELSTDDKKLVLDIYEEVFDHKRFTGRSGTFFGYEGLGSIYWHMVSKLLLAVWESFQWACDHGENGKSLEKLRDHFVKVYEGIGVHKAPSLYGAFPTDPYSHTPSGKGAQQPGMTGQVKEDILSRFGELGVYVRSGQIFFRPQLLGESEFLSDRKIFEYIDINHSRQKLTLEEGSLGFTYCQVPVVYKKSTMNGITVHYKGNQSQKSDLLALDRSTSQMVFSRTGEVVFIEVEIDVLQLNKMGQIWT